MSFCVATWTSCCTYASVHTRQVKRVEAHTAAVNQICFDEAAEYIASCSDDGSVAVSTASALLTRSACPFLLSRCPHYLQLKLYYIHLKQLFMRASYRSLPVQQTHRNLPWCRSKASTRMKLSPSNTSARSRCGLST